MLDVGDEERWNSIVKKAEESTRAKLTKQEKARQFSAANEFRRIKRLGIDEEDRQVRKESRSVGGVLGGKESNGVPVVEAKLQPGQGVGFRLDEKGKISGTVVTDPRVGPVLVMQIGDKTEVIHFREDETREKPGDFYTGRERWRLTLGRGTLKEPNDNDVVLKPGEPERQVISRRHMAIYVDTQKNTDGKWQDSRVVLVGQPTNPTVVTVLPKAKAGKWLRASVSRSTGSILNPKPGEPVVI